MNLSIVFMGSPEFAAVTLRRLAERYAVRGVVTQPDRPSGRGRTLTPPAVKLTADQLGIETIQPERLKEPEAQAALQRWSPDLIVVAAFGQILRKSVLTLPRYGCLNVHASLLPRWRGAAPIQAAILAGDAFSGVTLMQMDPGIDTGPTLAQESLPIHPSDTALTLSARLADLGAELLLRSLPAYLNGELLSVPQEDAASTYAPMLQKEEGALDFNQPADALERRVRAFDPWPGAYFAWQGSPLKVLRAQVTEATPPQSLAIGAHWIYQGQPAIQCGVGSLLLTEVQPAGKKAMPGKAFLAGARSWAQTPAQTPGADQP